MALKPKVRIERHSTTRNFTSPNVLGIIPGSDPSVANEYVLLMAHLDHNGTDPNLPGDKVYNGAMDNATGIATLLEVARAMTSGPRPRRPILVAAVTAEEDGLLGAQYLAKHPVLRDGKVVGVVNLDMPILLYDFTDVIAFGAEHSTLGPMVRQAGAQMNVALAADPLPEEGLFTRSDHYRFVQEGVPSVFLMTGFSNGGGEKFKEYLAKFYHRPSDQMDLPFNWDAGAKFARLNYLIARSVADAPDAPRWYESNFFGETFAPGQPRASKPR
jgi:Zn-dependent M28 family amino/carboxypeptidase